ncbi:hypothetical protein MPSEU_000724600 [Mayamaea pseudoterrestris]|nr:hypothetical protein MPSEU_000724600 [Mayamaea pseudoterrestris]
MPPKRIKKVMATPINVIFGHLQKKTRVRIWLYEDTRMQMEGQIIGFDEYMNFVLDDAVEIDTRKSQRLSVGRILLKGDAITMIQEAQPVRPVQQEEEQAPVDGGGDA